MRAGLQLTFGQFTRELPRPVRFLKKYWDVGETLDGAQRNLLVPLALVDAI